MQIDKHRLFDLVGAGLLLLLTFPVLFLFALLIRLTSPGPAFFRQVRLGREGRPFRIFKFRTMVAAQNSGPSITVSGDCRITPIGKILRRAKLDELPQLLNVLRGEMSIVGPRPEVPDYRHVYQNGLEKVLQVRPGITDPASLALADEEKLLRQFADPLRAYEQIVLPRKLAMSLAYLQQRRLRDDVRILLLTALTAFGFRRRFSTPFSVSDTQPGQAGTKPWPAAGQAGKSFLYPDFTNRPDQKLKA
jgi:lipopolysaccharide/colanic/teichoic acid biosynthesis glycosyltransferase